MTGRRYVGATGYRYGFNGMEKDSEVSGAGNSYDFGARMYDPRIGRWMSLDPLMAKYPYVSPYNFALDNPLMFIDPAGEDVVVAFTGGTSGKNKLTNVKDDTKYSKVKSQVGTTGSIVKDAQKFAEDNGVEFDGAVIQSGFKTKKATKEAVNFIKANYTKGEKIIIYGYSYGGKHALALIDALEKEGIDVDLLETVDPTNGFLGGGQNNRIDFEVNSNVKKSINRFQKIREKGTKALGGQTKASKEGQDVKNIEVANTTHQNIDEDVKPQVSKDIEKVISPDESAPNEQ